MQGCNFVFMHSTHECRAIILFTHSTDECRAIILCLRTVHINAGL